MRFAGWARIALAAIVALGVSGGAPAAMPERRARFDRFLAETRELYRQAGAVPRPARSRFGYADADLIDPRIVTDERVHALERYASYRALLAAAPVPADTPPVLPRPAGSATPEAFVPGADDGVSDASGAIARALVAGDVWLTPGRRYRIARTIVVPAHRRILSDGTATLLVATGGPGFPEVAFDPARASAGYADVIRVRGVGQVELRDFRIQTPIADAGAPQPLLHGVDIRDSAQVIVAGLELRGFARARGVIRVNSSRDVIVAANLIHGSYTRRLTRQVTGIEIDEARSRPSPNGPGGSSQRVTIAGNFVFGLLLDPAVYLDTSLRGGSPLNDETTGIALAATGPADTIAVTDNVVADVGQGIDIFSDGSRFARNVIERTPEFALKVGHGASRNRFDHFRIVASGLGAVLVYGVPGQAATGNVFTNFTIDHPGAVVGLPVPTSWALDVVAEHDAPASSVSGNSFAGIRVTGLPSGPGWKGAIRCSWPRDTMGGSAAPNRFHDVAPARGSSEISGGCAAID